MISNLFAHITNTGRVSRRQGPLRLALPLQRLFLVLAPACPGVAAKAKSRIGRQGASDLRQDPGAISPVRWGGRAAGTAGGAEGPLRRMRGLSAPPPASPGATE